MKLQVWGLYLYKILFTGNNFQMNADVTYKEQNHHIVISLVLHALANLMSLETNVLNVMQNTLDFQTAKVLIIEYMIFKEIHMKILNTFSMWLQ